MSKPLEDNLLSDDDKLEMTASEAREYAFGQNQLNDETVQYVSDHVFYVKGSLKRYWRLLALISVFYTIPAAQFVVYQWFNSQSNGSCPPDEPRCMDYFNFKCAKSVGFMFAFNNVISNIGYIIAGFVFYCIVRLWASSRNTEPAPAHSTSAPSDVEAGHHVEVPMTASGKVGLHTNPSLYYALALTLVLEGIFSSIYHIRPSELNFQFDTQFMLMGLGLSIITVYQKRHPRTVIGAQRAFTYFALAMIFNAIYIGGHLEHGFRKAAFWVTVGGVLLYLSIYGSLTLYYGRYGWAIDGRLPSRLGQRVRNFPRSIIPKNKLRFLGIVVVNAYSWVVYVLAISVDVEFFQFCFGMLSCHLIAYTGYYVFMKYKHKERVVLSVWITFAVTTVLMILAWWQFTTSVTNKLLTPEESRKLNKPCVLFGFFDNHDVWHFLSAGALFGMLYALFRLDADVEHKPREQICVF